MLAHRVISALATNTTVYSTLAELAGSSPCKAVTQSRVECSRISASHGIADMPVSNRDENHGIPDYVSLSMSAQAVVAIACMMSRI